MTRKNVNSDVITKIDLSAYKRILELTNAHLVGYEPVGDIQISRGVKYAKVISKPFPVFVGVSTAHYGNTGRRSEVATTKSMMAVTRST